MLRVPLPSPGIRRRRFRTIKALNQGHQARYGPASCPTKSFGDTHMPNLKLPRRKFLQLAAATAGLMFAPHVARAQTYPTRPVRIVVGYAPAGSTDIFTRLMAQWL